MIGPSRRLLCWALLAVTLAVGALAENTSAQTRETHGSFALFRPPARFTGQLPIVVYFHGAGGSDNLDYLLSNLARQGYFVVLPIYFEPEFVAMRDDAELIALPNYPSDPIWPHNWQDNAISGMVDGILEVGNDGDLNRLALAGHSLGGLFAAKVGQVLSNWGLPPRAIILHDGAGYAFTPMLTSPPRNLAEIFATYNGTWSRLEYDLDANDNFSGIRPETMVVSLYAHTSYVSDYVEEILFGLDGDAIGFGNGNVGGVPSHIWHTARSRQKHALVIMSDAGATEPSGHDGVLRYPYRDVYFRLTRDALAAAFNNRSWTPNPGEWIDGTPKAVTGVLVFPPRDFAWSCQALDALLGSLAFFPADFDNSEAHEFLHRLYLPPEVICY